jgi:2'-5' RNA ligase
MNMNTHRYFIGIALPEAISETLSQFQKSHYMLRSMMKPLIPHITLLHPDVLMTISPIFMLPVTKDIGRDFLPMNITLGKINTFNDRVLHIEIESTEVTSIQQQLVDALPGKLKSQYYVGRNFTPHITILQAKHKLKIPEQTVNACIDSLQPIIQESFQVNELSQFIWNNPREYSVKSI